MLGEGSSGKATLEKVRDLVMQHLEKGKQVQRLDTRGAFGCPRKCEQEGERGEAGQG